MIPNSELSLLGSIPYPTVIIVFLETAKESVLIQGINRKQLQKF